MTCPTIDYPPCTDSTAVPAPTSTTIAVAPTDPLPATGTNAGDLIAPAAILLVFGIAGALAARRSDR